MQEFNQTIKIPPETLPKIGRVTRSGDSCGRSEIPAGQRRFQRASGETGGKPKIPAGERKTTQLAAALILSLSLSLSLTLSFSLTNHSFLG